MALLKTGGMYDFSVYAANELGGAVWRRVSVEAGMTYKTAITLDGDIVAKHRAVLATGLLPSNTPVDPKQLFYYRLQLPDGSYKIVAEAWMVPDSVVEVEEVGAYLYFPRVTTEDLARIQAMFGQAGITDYELRYDNNFGT